MLETIIKYGVIFYVMGILLAAGMAAKIISQATIRKMAQEASEIQKSNHKLMKLVKAKFEHATMVSDKVQNVGVFVKKYLYEYRILGVRLSTWRGVAMKMMWLIGCIGALGTLGSFRIQGLTEQTFQYASITAVMVMVLFVVQIMGSEAVKLEMVENYIVDYLENVCTRRYEKTNHAAERMETLEKQDKKGDKPEIDTSKERMEQEMRIRAILEEFLA